MATTTPEEIPFVIKYVLYVSSSSLACIAISVTFCFIWLMIDPRVKNDPIYGIIAPAFNNTVIAFISIASVSTGWFARGKMKN